MVLEPKLFSEVLKDCGILRKVGPEEMMTSGGILDRFIVPRMSDL